jgi:hypothetical protein
LSSSFSCSGAYVIALPDPIYQTVSLGTGVKIALVAAPFSWLRGGPARAMKHLGDYGQDEGQGLEKP